MTWQDAQRRFEAAFDVVLDNIVSNPYQPLSDVNYRLETIKGEFTYVWYGREPSLTILKHTPETGVLLTYLTPHSRYFRTGTLWGPLDWHQIAKFWVFMGLPLEPLEQQPTAHEKLEWMMEMKRLGLEINPKWYW